MPSIMMKKMFVVFSLCMLAMAAEFSVSMANPILVNDESCSNCLKLNNDRLIPIVGLGTSKLGKTDEEVTRAIKDAIDVGYRHIDTADFYLNEKAIGEALEELIKAGKVKRNELFITTKVWSNHHSKDLAIKSIQNSIKDLRLDYVDLVLIHWPVSFQSGGDYVPRHANGSIIGADLKKENFQLAYQGLEEALDQNLTKSIGLSNFNISQIEKLLNVARHKPSINQVESHPYLNQQELLDYCNSKNILLEAYSPLRRGDVTLLENETLKNIALNHNKTVAQVAIRWQIQRGVVVIPKTSRRTRMVENKEVFSFELSDEQMKQINALDTKNPDSRFIKFEECKHLPEYPF